MECLLWTSSSPITDEALEDPAWDFFPAKWNSRWKKGRLSWFLEDGVAGYRPLDVAVVTDLSGLGVWELHSIT
jgi:hypothetical protein